MHSIGSAVLFHGIDMKQKFSQTDSLSLCTSPLIQRPDGHIFSSAVLVIGIVVTSHVRRSPHSPLNTASIWGGGSKFRNLGIKEPEWKEEAQKGRSSCGKKRRMVWTVKSSHILHTEIEAESRQLATLTQQPSNRSFSLKAL